MNQAIGPAGEPLEIERKFLIRRPDRALLERHSTGCLVMEQIYLTRRQKGESRRIRQSTREGQTLYYYNEKVRLSSIKRIEREWEISRAEYEALQREADPDCAVIRKERWLIPAGALTLDSPGLLRGGAHRGESAGGAARVDGAAAGGHR